MMRRHTILEYAMLLFCIAIAVVSAIATFGDMRPPTPYVRLDSDRIAPIYLSRVECVNGFELQTYAQDGGEEIAPILTDRPCANHPSR